MLSSKYDIIGKSTMMYYKERYNTSYIKTAERNIRMNRTFLNAEGKVLSVNSLKYLLVLIIFEESQPVKQF